MKKTKWFRFCFVMFCLLAATKLAALGVIIGQVIVHLIGEAAMDDVSSTTIWALLVDFVALLGMWGVQKGLHLYRKRTSVCTLLTPVLLLVVLGMSIIMVGFDAADPTAQLLNGICWGLMALYLLIPDALILCDVLTVRKRKQLQETTDDPLPEERSLHDRIRTAKK